MVETLEECSIEKLDEREIFYISKYNTFKNGYNLTIGGDGNKRLLLDDKYDEIKNLYLTGFSSNKIAILYNIDKATVVKILKQLDVKIRTNKLNINNQELQELIRDYKTGFSLRELAKRYDCSALGLKEFLIRKGVDIRDKYNILSDNKQQEKLIADYINNNVSVDKILHSYHCSYNTFKKILSMYNIKLKGNIKHYKLNDTQCLEVIKLYNSNLKVVEISKIFKVDKCTIYAILRRYNIKLSDDIITPRVSTS